MRKIYRQIVSRERYEKYKNLSKYPEHFSNRRKVNYLIGFSSNKFLIKIFEEELYVSLKTYKEKFQKVLT